MRSNGLIAIAKVATTTKAPAPRFPAVYSCSGDVGRGFARTAPTMTMNGKIAGERAGLAL